MTDQNDDPNNVGTTGHSWDGIEELNNPLPRWWVWTFYLTILWGVLYTVAYPAYPLIERATGGLLGYSTRAEVTKAIAAHDARNADLIAALGASGPDDLAQSPELAQYAVARGAAVFRTNCSQCHGAGAAGGTGYPNLLDDDWLWGGDLDSITQTVRHGIRNDTDPDARYSEMPAFGDFLSDAEITAVTAHVAGLSAGARGSSEPPLGAEVYADNCAACHGADGSGDADMGAPNLADAIWLYGSDADTIEHSVRRARFGVMPAWGERLSDVDVRAVSAYVHGLGGGE